MSGETRGGGPSEGSTGAPGAGDRSRVEGEGVETTGGGAREFSAIEKAGDDSVDAGIGERPLTIAITALGGQGGGVLTQWLVDIAEDNGYLAQSTYVAGVAQRTGATVYCVEMFPRKRAEEIGREPVFALYPVPGDVDLVVASELIEMGRAIQKGFVTPNATTLIASSHRVYSITEKTALGDGIVADEPLLEAGKRVARRFVCFDMQTAAEDAGCIISSVLLGAIAGSGALPFSREIYEEAIRRGGRAVEANLAGFAAGFDGARASAEGAEASLPESEPAPPAEPAGENGRALAARIAKELPEPCRDIALHGALRVLDYQDRAYAEAYLDRLAEARAWDEAAGGAARGFALTHAVAPPLALQMCYEDSIRVADLKTRGERMAGIREDVRVEPDQPAYVVEYFHPRYEEFCDTLPAGLGARLLASDRARRWTGPLFRKGRTIDTTKIGGFLLLRTLAKLGRWRRRTYRFRLQQQRVEAWLGRIREAAEAGHYDYARAVAESIEIVRGYGETYERGLSRYEAMLDAAERAAPGERASIVRRLHAAALADEEGRTFERALLELDRRGDDAAATKDEPGRQEPGAARAESRATMAR